MLINSYLKTPISYQFFVCLRWCQCAPIIKCVIHLSVCQMLIFDDKWDGGGPYTVPRKAQFQSSCPAHNEYSLCNLDNTQFEQLREKLIKGDFHLVGSGSVLNVFRSAFVSSFCSGFGSCFSWQLDPDANYN